MASQRSGRRVCARVEHAAVLGVGHRTVVHRDREAVAGGKPRLALVNAGLAYFRNASLQPNRKIHIARSRAHATASQTDKSQRGAVVGRKLQHAAAAHLLIRHRRSVGTAAAATDLRERGAALGHVDEAHPGGGTR